MKKFGPPILVGLIIGGMVGGGYLWWVKSRSVTSNAGKEFVVSSAPTPAPLLTWNDTNGFTFQYPEGLSVNKHDEDRENYAHIELTHPGHPGSLIVWGKDPAKGVSDVASWVKNENRFIGASMLDTELGRQEAKKVIVDGVTRMLVVGTVYDGIVWSVEAKLEDVEFWTGVHTAIVNAFTFTSVKESGPAATSDPAPVVDDGTVDEEEVVE